MTEYSARLSLYYRFTISAETKLLVLYTPYSDTGESQKDYGSQWELTPTKTDGPGAGPSLLKRLEQLLSILARYVEPQPMVTPDGVIRPAIEATQLKIDDLKSAGTIVVSWHVEVPAARIREQQAFFELASLPDEVRRLAEDIRLEITAISWAHIRTWAKSSRRSLRSPRVFISYRSTQQDAAKAIARRLAKLGVEPWFDAWSVVAGDSLPRKIEEAFQTTDACALLWSVDHPEGRWCTEELETALHKRVHSGYPIVPVRLDSSPLPDLLAKLRYVDLTDWSNFERGVGEIAQAVLSLEPRPRHG